jgi:hypothetical protein
LLRSLLLRSLRVAANYTPLFQRLIEHLSCIAPVFVTVRAKTWETYREALQVYVAEKERRRWCEEERARESMPPSAAELALAEAQRVAADADHREHMKDSVRAGIWIDDDELETELRVDLLEEGYSVPFYGGASPRWSLRENSSSLRSPEGQGSLVEPFGGDRYDAIGTSPHAGRQDASERRCTWLWHAFA